MFPKKALKEMFGNVMRVVGSIFGPLVSVIILAHGSDLENLIIFMSSKLCGLLAISYSKASIWI